MALKMYDSKKAAGVSAVGSIIAVASGKGGVGKSTVAAHLARSLQSLGFSVGVMDTDLYGPSLKRMLPEQVPPKETKEGIIPADSFGIKLISMAHFRHEAQAALLRAPIANGIIDQFVRDVIWGPLDFLIVDFPPGTGDIQLTLCQKLAINFAVLVTTPQKVALMDVLKSMEMFEEMKIPLLGVLENMSYWQDPKTGEKHNLFGEGGGKYLAQSSGISFLGHIPVDPSISSSCDAGKPLPEKSLAPFIDLAKFAADASLKNKLSHQVALKDPKTIQIMWLDGSKSEFDASWLQRRCPCAACGEKKAENSCVEARGIVLAGRYGFRVKFSSGCSMGIFEFEELRKCR